MVKTSAKENEILSQLQQAFRDQLKQKPPHIDNALIIAQIADHYRDLKLEIMDHDVLQMIFGNLQDIERERLFLVIACFPNPAIAERIIDNKKQTFIVNLVEFIQQQKNYDSDDLDTFCHDFYHWII